MRSGNVLCQRVVLKYQANQRCNSDFPVRMMCRFPRAVITAGKPPPFDQQLNSLLANKTDLSDAVVAPEEVKDTDFADLF